jgi:Putative restriction endonuclease
MLLRLAMRGLNSEPKPRTRIQAGSLCYFGLMVGDMQVLSTYRFTVDEYHRLGEVGILGEDDRVELLDGDLINMAPIGGEHRTLVDSLTLLFASHAGG